MTVSAQKVAEFDVWREGYAGATVEVFRAGTTRLASLFYDLTLTDPAPNPITLDSLTQGNRTFGKFERSVYLAGAYQLRINGTDMTGVVRPYITSLLDEDASYATAKTARGTAGRRLIDRFDDEIRALDFGELGATAATNTATLNAAIGAASGQGGGRVLLPAGSFEFTTVTLSKGVVLVGEGVDATTLRSQQGEAVVTLGGDRAGLARLTLDGENLVAGSIGVQAEAKDRLVFDDVLIKRFETGLHFEGGSNSLWRDLIVENCGKGIEMLGDGAEWSHNLWIGGGVRQCTDDALILKFVDEMVRHNSFQRLKLDSNTASAVYIEGAQFTRFTDSEWTSNTTNIEVLDGSDTSQGDDNKVIELTVEHSRLSGGGIEMDDTCQDVLFLRVSFADVDWDLNLPINPIQLLDCIEDPQVTVTGDTSKLARFRANNDGEYSGVTTDATYTTAFSYSLEAGQVVYVEAKVIGNQRDGKNYGVFHVAAGARRPGATLKYDNQSGAFTVGTVLTGATSGATARIIADDDDGTTGTLTLRDITGAFEDNEAITDTATGAALANGVLSFSDTVLDNEGGTAIRPGMSTYGTLAYDNESAAFNEGATLTGGTSGATATIVAVEDNGTDGTLTLENISGTFQDDEAIADDGGTPGSAAVNGELTASLDAKFAVSGANLQLQVRGVANDTYEWTVRVDGFTP